MTKRKTLAWRLNKDDDGGFDEIVVGMGLAGHQALLHAEMMNTRDIFVSIGSLRIWAHVNRKGEVVVTGTETDDPPKRGRASLDGSKADG